LGKVKFGYRRYNWIVKKAWVAMGILGEDFMGWMVPKDFSSVTLLPSQALQPCVTLNRGEGEKKIQNPPFL
jgi:hypothetical protein